METNAQKIMRIAAAHINKEKDAEMMTRRREKPDQHVTPRTKRIGLMSMEEFFEFAKTPEFQAVVEDTMGLLGVSAAILTGMGAGSSAAGMISVLLAKHDDIYPGAAATQIGLAYASGAIDADTKAELLAEAGLENADVCSGAVN